jgi:hypothetical protein
MSPFPPGFPDRLQGLGLAVSIGRVGSPGLPEGTLYGVLLPPTQQCSETSSQIPEFPIFKWEIEVKWVHFCRQYGLAFGHQLDHSWPRMQCGTYQPTGTKLHVLFWWMNQKCTRPNTGGMLITSWLFGNFTHLSAELRVWYWLGLLSLYMHVLNWNVRCTNPATPPPLRHKYCQWN